MKEKKNEPRTEAAKTPSAGSHCMPGNQKFAREFLSGKVPAVMEQVAPDSQTGEDGYRGWQESDETVERLRQWREEAPYG